MDKARRVYIVPHPTLGGYTLQPHWTDTSSGNPVIASAATMERYSSVEAATAAAKELYQVGDSEIRLLPGRPEASK